MVSFTRTKHSKPFDRVLQHEFPGAVPQHQFLDATAIELANRGFEHRNTLACVATCRDELTAPFVNAVETLWGPSFRFSSLAGMLTAGRTGFVAAIEHAPGEGGRRRVVLYAMSHVGIDDDGTIGAVTRPGVAHTSSACGALAALRDDIDSASTRTAFDPFDPEQSLLAARILPMVRVKNTPDLAELARLTVQAIDQDIWEILDRVASGHDGHDEKPLVSAGAVFTGIQIHQSGGRHYVWPHASHLIGPSSAQPLELAMLAGSR